MRRIKGKPKCCSLNITTAEECPNGLVCINGLDCSFKEETSNGKINQKPRQKRNPEKDFKPPRNSRKRKKK